jgi:hypothetical protein
VKAIVFFAIHSIPAQSKTMIGGEDNLAPFSDFRSLTDYQ